MDKYQKYKAYQEIAECTRGLIRLGMTLDEIYQALEDREGRIPDEAKAIMETIWIMEQNA